MPTVNQKLRVIIEGDNRASDDFKQIGTDAEQSMGGGSKGLGGLASGASIALVGVGTAVVGVGVAIGKAVSIAGEFEQGMAGVTAVTQATGADFDKLRDLALKMGSETQFSATEAAEGMAFLGQAGFDADQILSALPDTLELAAAGNLELGEAADISSNVLSGMRLPVSELGSVVDGLAAVAAKSNTNVQQLGGAFAQAAPGLAAAGVSFEDAAAAIGVLGDNGIQAGAAGTALNAAIRTMIKPSKEAADRAKELGLNFVDAAGNARPLSEVIGELEDKSITAKDAMILFGEEGGRAINALVGSGSQRFNELRSTIDRSEGAAGRMAHTLNDTLEGSTKSLGSAFEGLMISVGDQFLPLVRSAIDDYITPAVRAFTDWSNSVGGIGGILGDAADLFIGFGKTIWNVIDTFFGDEGFRSKVWDGIVGTFSTVLTEVPKMLVFRLNR